MSKDDLFDRLECAYLDFEEVLNEHFSGFEADVAIPKIERMYLCARKFSEGTRICIRGLIPGRDITAPRNETKAEWRIAGVYAFPELLKQIEMLKAKREKEQEGLAEAVAFAETWLKTKFEE